MNLSTEDPSIQLNLKETNPTKKHSRIHRKKSLNVSDSKGDFKTNPTKELTHHQQINSVDGSSSCKYKGCNFSTTQHSKLARHILSHAAEKPYECNVCKETFRIKDNLISHTCGARPVKKTFEYKSKVRGVSSRNYDGLATHEVVHEGKSVYKCSFKSCTFTCTFAKRLKKHELTHGKTKPFKCSICPYSSLSSWHLKRHIVSNHKFKKPKKDQNGPVSLEQDSSDDSVKVLESESSSEVQEIDNTDEDDITVQGTTIIEELTNDELKDSLSSSINLEAPISIEVVTPEPDHTLINHCALKEPDIEVVSPICNQSMSQSLLENLEPESELSEMDAISKQEEINIQTCENQQTGLEEPEFIVTDHSVQEEDGANIISSTPSQSMFIMPQSLLENSDPEPELCTNDIISKQENTNMLSIKKQQPDLEQTDHILSNPGAPEETETEIISPIPSQCMSQSLLLANPTPEPDPFEDDVIIEGEVNEPNIENQRTSLEKPDLMLCDHSEVDEAETEIISLTPSPPMSQSLLQNPDPEPEPSEKNVISEKEEISMLNTQKLQTESEEPDHMLSDRGGLDEIVTKIISPTPSQSASQSLLENAEPEPGFSEEDVINEEEEVNMLDIQKQQTRLEKPDPMSSCHSVLEETETEIVFPTLNKSASQSLLEKPGSEPDFSEEDVVSEEEINVPNIKMQQTRLEEPDLMSNDHSLLEETETEAMINCSTPSQSVSQSLSESHDSETESSGEDSVSEEEEINMPKIKKQRTKLHQKPGDAVTDRNETIYECKVCVDNDSEFRTTNLVAFRAHQQWHTAMGCLFCGSCDFVCFNQKVLTKHFEEHHRFKINNVLKNDDFEPSSLTCVKSFSEIQSPKKVARLNKPSCSRTSMTVKAADNFSCQVCGKPFPRQMAMLKHLREHTGLKIKF